MKKIQIRTIKLVKSERHVVEVEKGGSEEERQSSQEKGKATKEETPPWGVTRKTTKASQFAV